MILKNSLKTAFPVALLAEGVDRNSQPPPIMSVTRPSPSSRRAWIEINLYAAKPWGEITVALLAEGVDRNYKLHKNDAKPLPSPSSRRAWIEIFAARLA